MKQFFKTYSIIIISLLGLTIITSLILASIEKMNLINYKNSLYVSTVLSYLYILVFSFILGVKVKNKGILHGFIFSFILFLITIVVGNANFDWISIVKIITKSVIAIFFTIVGVNKKGTN